MTQALQLAPPSDPGEIETLTFDFAPALGVGETIVTVTSMLVAIVIGTDTGTNSHFQGAATITASPSTGAASAAVIQQVQNMVGGCTYQFQCLVQTTAGQRLQLRVNLPCAVVPTGKSS